MQPRWVPGVLALALTACGGGGGSTAPTPAAAAPTISTSNDLVYIGQTVTFAAAGTGTITWGGDAPTIATIDGPTGRVTGVGTGRVTIWAENAGGRTTRLLRVLPSYNGSWSGSYTLTGCQATGDFPNNGFCEAFSPTQVLSIGFNITQTRDTVTGSFSLGALQGTLSSGVVNEDGTLPLSGTFTNATLTIQVSNLSATSPSAGTIRGNFDQIWSSTGLTGTGRLTCNIRDMTRTSGAPILGGDTGTAGGDLSLDGLIRRALIRF